MRFASLLAAATVCCSTVATAQSPAPDNTSQAMAALQTARTEQYRLLAAKTTDQQAIMERMLDLGMWQAVDSVLALRGKDPGSQLLRADLFILNNNFFAAAKLVDAVLKQSPGMEKAVRLRAYLDMQAWRLEQAATSCRTYLAKKPSEKMTVLLGKIYLLQKKYPEAIQLADQLLEKNPSLAAAYQLKADVYFWDQQPAKAEAPLLKSLELDPFNADARFSYGYAIWRRVDATQLNAMAAQWEVALAVNPLHFQTHWHWGNGHTNLTYADYAEPTDDQVRERLKKADSLFQTGQFAAAIARTVEAEKEFPSSVIPLLHRASLYYANFDDASLIRLDSAENIFKRILARKKHYGPAHNGLSAVIKSKRIPFLANYEAVTKQLKHPAITDMASFERVFPDVAYYPGTIAKGMVWNQMYTAVVYFPFLSKMNRQFHVPPLHIDLATTMNSPSFRASTTFDNRQWMDIRGVGSGAAAIEYVERGAYGERNVVLHEYVHLFHGSVLTDEENRAVRAHYYKAMKENRTLDYYSQNNESEYLRADLSRLFRARESAPA
ncbi:MAG: tetratricopeptide repeat protein [Flavihumibacter sp.]